MSKDPMCQVRNAIIETDCQHRKTEKPPRTRKGKSSTQMRKILPDRATRRNDVADREKLDRNQRGLIRGSQGRNSTRGFPSKQCKFVDAAVIEQMVAASAIHHLLKRKNHENRYWQFSCGVGRSSIDACPGRLQSGRRRWLKRWRQRRGW